MAYEIRDFPTSVYAMRSILRIAPDHYDVECRLGDTLYALSDQSPECEKFNEARDIYESVIARKPNYSFAVNGIALFATNDVTRRKLLEHAVSLNSRNCYALANLGGHYLLCTDLVNESHQLLKRALDINPNLFYARIHMSVALVHLGQIEDAITCLKTQLQMQPSDSKALSLLRLLTLQLE